MDSRTDKQMGWAGGRADGWMDVPWNPVHGMSRFVRVNKSSGTLKDTTPAWLPSFPIAEVDAPPPPPPLSCSAMNSSDSTSHTLCRSLLPHCGDVSGRSHTMMARGLLKAAMYGRTTDRAHVWTHISTEP
eukprot:24023-Chlamydomonas_euryale.AAC.1